MSNPDILIVKIRQRREQKVELEPGRTLTILRPPEADFFSLSRSLGVDACVKYATGWEGFTEADVLPSGGGDPVEFHADLWREVVSDRLDWLAKVQNAIVESVNRRTEERKAAAGN